MAELPSFLGSRKIFRHFEIDFAFGAALVNKEMRRGQQQTVLGLARTQSALLETLE